MSEGHKLPLQTLAFDAYSVAWRGQSLQSISASLAVPRLALVGSFGAFAAHAAGAPDAIGSGSVSLGGNPLRSLVMNGQVGVARAAQVLPKADTVGGWLAESLILGGASAANAERTVRRDLEALGLGFLRTRQASELSPAEYFGAQLAYAWVGEPMLSVVPAPRVPEAHMQFCRRLLDAAVTRCQVAVVFDGEPDLELLRWCDHVLGAQESSLSANHSVDAWLAAAVHYRLQPFSRNTAPDAGFSALEQRLREQGVRVQHAVRSQLTVSLPTPGTSDRILRACQESAVGVRELTPLFFAPSAG